MKIFFKPDVRRAAKVALLLAGVIFLPSALLPSPVQAGGFQVSDQGAAGAARARAFVAGVSDASAMYYNPAAMTFLSGFNANFSATVIAPQSVYYSPSATQVTTTYTVSPVALVPNAYLTYTQDNFAVGFGVHAPYGLGVEWPATNSSNQAWEGRGIIQRTSLRNLFFNLNLAYKFENIVSVSAGASLVSGNVELERAIPNFSNSDGKVFLKGTGTGFGFNVSALFKPVEALRIGATFRSQVKMTYKGDADFTPPSAGLAANFPDGPGEADITLPASIKVGAAFRPLLSSEELFWKNFEIEVDYDFHNWSAYQDLPIRFTNSPSLNSASVKNFQNNFQISAAVESKVTKDLRVRFGYVFDKAAVPDGYLEPLLPDADRNGFSLGFGYELTENIGLDAAAVYIAANRRTESASTQGFNGTYTTTAPLLSASLRIKL